MLFRTTHRFDKELSELPVEIAEKFWKQLELLLQNPRHPSLHTKKIRRKRGVWEARVDQKYRFTFHYESGVIVLRAIGNHDDVLNNP